MWLGTASCMAEVFTLMLLSGSHAELLLLPCWLVGTATHGPEMHSSKLESPAGQFAFFKEVHGLVGL